MGAKRSLNPPQASKTSRLIVTALGTISNPLSSISFNEGAPS